MFTLRKSDNNDNNTETSSASPSPTPFSSPAAAGDVCGSVDNQCSFVDEFPSLNDTRWIRTHDSANGSPFGVWWDKNSITFPMTTGDDGTERKANDSDSVVNINNRMMQIEMMRKEDRFNKTYASGQLRTKGWFQYGCFEANIQPVNRPG